jgi:hypothetical protein
MTKMHGQCLHSSSFYNRWLIAWADRENWKQIILKAFCYNSHNYGSKYKQLHRSHTVIMHFRQIPYLIFLGLSLLPTFPEICGMKIIIWFNLFPTYLIHQFCLLPGHFRCIRHNITPYTSTMAIFNCQILQNS